MIKRYFVIPLVVISMMCNISYFKNFSQNDLLCLILSTEVERGRGREDTGPDTISSSGNVSNLGSEGFLVNSNLILA